MYTAYATYTIRCPAGETGPAVTKGGSAESVISQRDADVKALGLAMRLAYEFLICEFPPGPEVPRFCSAPVYVTASAEAGYVPETFPVYLPACAIYSIISQADADAAALLAAQTQANHARDVGQRLIFYNSAQTWSDTCNSYLGADREPGSVTYTVPAGAAISHTSQGEADMLALAEAKSQVISILTATCVPIYHSAAASYTAHCTLPLVGTPVTRAIAAGVYLSNISQADADAQALAVATTAANDAIVCIVGFYNTPQTANLTCVGSFGANWYGADVSVTIPAGSYAAATQVDADAEALVAAYVAAGAQQVCVWGGVGPEP